jgi:hypothetical protein
VETQLRQALSDADDLAEATFAIGQAQGALSTVLQLDATEALIELGTGHRVTRWGYKKPHAASGEIRQ